MRVLFVYLVPPPQFQILRFQQGIGSISAVLKQGGHSTDLLYVWDAADSALDQRIRDFKPGLVAISLTSGFFDLGCAVAKRLKQQHGLPVLFGGVHPTLRPEESIAAEGVFAICVGEGEYPTLELCNALDDGRDPTAIPNLWVRQGKRLHRNPIRPLIANLDRLPFPDREIFPVDELLKTLPEAEFMGSRGCPHLCTYCVNHTLIDLYKGQGPFVRYRSVDNLLDEIAQVTARYPAIRFLGFHDDTFTLNQKWLAEFAEKYPARFPLKFWCNSTARRINEQTIALLKRAGCYEIRIGVESGNDHIRMEVLQKKVTREEIVNAFRLIREAGIDAYAFNMIGLPGETPATVEDTIRLNQILRPKEVFCSVFHPYPGTRLYDLCTEKGWYAGKAVRSYFEGDYALQQPTITARQVRYYHDIFNVVVRYPRLSATVRLMASIPVTRNKTLWNAFRRVKAKCGEFWSSVSGRGAPPRR